MICFQGRLVTVYVASLNLTYRLGQIEQSQAPQCKQIGIDQVNLIRSASLVCISRLYFWRSKILLPKQASGGQIFWAESLKKIMHLWVNASYARWFPITSQDRVHAASCDRRGRVWTLPLPPASHHLALWALTLAFPTYLMDCHSSPGLGLWCPFCLAPLCLPFFLSKNWPPLGLVCL